MMSYFLGETGREETGREPEEKLPRATETLF